MEPSLNVLGEPLQPCSTRPLTGFYRNGCCDTGPEDHGSHTICVIATREFLAFSKYLGNDLSTPRPEYGFAGLKAGDRWCVCASRWLEAYRAGGYCFVVVGSTQKGRGLKAGLRSSRRYYAALDEASEETVTFSPYRDGADPVEFSYDFSFNYAPRAFERPGPVVEIHRLRDCG